MRTLIALENGNCTHCHNALLVRLRSIAAVRNVQSDFASGCLVIDHDTDPDALISMVTASGRGIYVAANGEPEMVAVDGHHADECPVADGRSHAYATGPEGERDGHAPDQSDVIAARVRPAAHRPLRPARPSPPRSLRSH